MTTANSNVSREDSTTVILYMHECRRPVEVGRRVSAIHRQRKGTRVALVGKGWLARFVAWVILKTARMWTTSPTPNGAFGSAPSRGQIHVPAHAFDFP